MATDLHALRAQTHDRSSIADVLPTMTMPCLLFTGDADPRFPKVKECLASLPNGTFFSLSGCGHVAACARSDLVLPHMSAFLAKINQ